MDNGTQAASANFIFDNGGASTTLSIQLMNDMTTTGNFSPQWLTGLFFDLAGSPTLNYLGLGGTGGDGFNDMVIGSRGPNSNSPDIWNPYNAVTVDHFWALSQTLGAGDLPFGSQQFGLGAAGFGVFGPGNILNYQAGGPHPQPDGSDGGILSGSLLDPNGDGDYSDALINVPNGHTREMTDGGLWLTFDLGNYQFDEDSVSNIHFVFGTSFGEGGGPIVPVPPAVGLGLVGLCLAAIGRRRFARLTA